MDVVVSIGRETWWLVAEMAPYLWLGLLISGALYALITPAQVQRHLGQRGLGQVVKASVIGIPLPVCSCGIIPIAIGLRQQGGSKGAIAAFTAATPQTGVDSILATGGLLGWPFAGIRVGVALVSGVVVGWLVDTFAGQAPRQPAQDAQSHEGHTCCGGHPPAETPSCCAHEAEAPTTRSQSRCDENQPKTPTEKAPGWAAGMRFAFWRLPQDISGALLLGFALAGLLSTFLSADTFAGWLGAGVMAYLAASLISLPLYVCSTGSIPLALALVQAGLSPGAALIFLILGPATNTTTVTALWQHLGPKAIALYLGGLVATAWGAAALLDLMAGQLIGAASHSHLEPLAWWQHLCGILLLLLLLAPLLQGLVQRLRPSAQTKQPCCDTNSKSTPSSCCSSS